MPVSVFLRSESVAGMKRKTHMASHAKMVIIKLNLGGSTAMDFEFTFCGVYHGLPMGVSLRGGA